MALLTFAMLKASARPTLRNLAENGEGFAKSMAESWTAGWKGDEEERVASKRAHRLHRSADRSHLRHRLRVLQLRPGDEHGAGLVLESLRELRVLGRDALGSRRLCDLGILSRNKEGFAGQITERRMHDIGKLMFAFSIFWMYLFWSQYLVIYYGNLPEETYFIRDRLGDQFMIDKGYSAAAFAKSWQTWDFEWARLQTGYGWVSMVVWACNWLIPFWVLLGQRPKKTPWIAGPVAGLLLFGLWLERNLLVWPSVVKGDMLSWFGAIQIGVALGFGGAFLAVVLYYSRVFPTIAVAAKD